MPEPSVVAVIQSSYIPWKGYFDIIGQADTFILLDDVQYTKRDWRSRNRIKTPDGIRWLTIPVHSKGSRALRIMDAQVSDPSWADRHWRALHHAYARAPHFEALAAAVEDAYNAAADERHLSRINRLLLDAICGYLEVSTQVLWSTDVLPLGRLDALDASRRLAELTAEVGGTTYLSGPSARAYMDLDVFRGMGIEVEFVDYDRYPEYPQLHGSFEHHVSVLDLIANVGPSSSTFIHPPND